MSDISTIYEGFAEVPLPVRDVWIPDIAEYGLRSDFFLPAFGQVQNIVAQLAKRCGHRLSVEDCTQESVFAFVDACQRFDLSKSIAFSSYFYFRCQYAIQRANATQGGCISSPVDVAKGRNVDYSLCFEPSGAIVEEHRCVFEDLDIAPIDWDDLMGMLPNQLRDVAIAFYQKDQTAGKAAKDLNVPWQRAVALRSEMCAELKQKLKTDRQLSLLPLLEVS